MITPFGKYLRNIRMDRGEKLKDMAAVLGISSSFLSRVENGKTKPPEKWKNVLVSHYGLSEKEEEELLCRMSDVQRTYIRLKEFSPDEREIITTLADQIGQMEQEKKDEIRKILTEQGEKCYGREKE